MATAEVPGEGADLHRDLVPVSWTRRVRRAYWSGPICMPAASGATWWVSARMAS